MADFHDPEFTREDTLLWAMYRQPPTWTRASQLAIGCEMPLFEAIAASDMRQGRVGDCWLLAAMASLAEYPEEVEALFVSKASPETSPRHSAI